MQYHNEHLFLFLSSLLSVFSLFISFFLFFCIPFLLFFLSFCHILSHSRWLFILIHHRLLPLTIVCANKVLLSDYSYGQVFSYRQSKGMTNASLLCSLAVPYPFAMLSGSLLKVSGVLFQNPYKLEIL